MREDLMSFLEVHKSQVWLRHGALTGYIRVTPPYQARLVIITILEYGKMMINAPAFKSQMN